VFLIFVGAVCNRGYVAVLWQQPENGGFLVITLFITLDGKF